MLLGLTSCWKVLEPDSFEESSSARLNTYLENVRTLLQTPSNGWILEYYPGSSYAATSFALKFTGQKVTAIHEDNVNEDATSTYRLTTDDGPVLSFDTYNTVLHKYATPSASKYQAKGGDFEFDILSYSDEAIILRGKRSRNICTLRPLSKRGDFYLDDVKYMEKTINVAAVSVTIDGEEMIGYLDSGIRSLSIGGKDQDESELATIRYVVTDKGIRFMRPLTLAPDASFESWEYDSENTRFTAGGYNFDKTIPKGWVSYDDYLGNYTLYYGGGETMNVTLAQKEKEVTFALKGVSSGFDIEIGYSGGRGRLTWVRQTVGGTGSSEIALCPWDSDAGYYTWLENVGMYGYVTDTTGVPEAFTVNFADNRVWEDYHVSAWLVMQISGESRTGASGKWVFSNGSYQLPGPLSMEKK